MCSCEQLEHRAEGADAGVRDDDVDAAEALGRRVAQALQRRRVAHVARQSEDARQAEVVAAARGEPEVRAARVQQPRDRRADAAARARHHRRPALNAHRPPPGRSRVPQLRG